MLLLPASALLGAARMDAAALGALRNFAGRAAVWDRQLLGKRLPWGIYPRGRGRAGAGRLCSSGAPSFAESGRTSGAGTFDFGRHQTLRRYRLRAAVSGNAG